MLSIVTFSGDDKEQAVCINKGDLDLDVKSHIFSTPGMCHRACATGYECWHCCLKHTILTKDRKGSNVF